MSTRPTIRAMAPHASASGLGGRSFSSDKKAPLFARGASAPEPAPRFSARRARAADADAVYALITHYAAQGLLLPRSDEDVRTNIDHFLVLTQTGRVIGCVALEPYGADLAEIRSLAVAADFAGGGRGARLVRFALAIAKRRKIARVFAVTHAPEFFERLGFAPADRRSIIEKVERDCRTCPKRKSCSLIAVTCVVLPASIVLPVVTNRAATPAL